MAKNVRTTPAEAENEGVPWLAKTVESKTDLVILGLQHEGKVKFCRD